MKTFKLQTAIAQVLDISSNPLLTRIKFVFADDKPNNNNQAIAADEFEALAANALGMPIKINFIEDFFGDDASNHAGSYPIGHISDMEQDELADGTKRLIGYANIWNEEFPKEVEWLKKRFAEGNPPGLSWELKYQNGVVEDGIEWLKGVIAAAATFVKFPAYGARTSLLALASIQEPENNSEEVSKVLLAIAEQLAPKEPIEEGGNQMTEEEAKKLQDELAAKSADAATKQEEIDRLNGLLTTKDEEVTALRDEIASLQRTALVETRVKKYTDLVGALPAEASEADSKKTLFASLSEEQFEAMIKELVDLKTALTPKQTPAQAAAASLRTARPLEIPRLEVPAVSETAIQTAREEFKSLARPNSA